MGWYGSWLWLAQDLGFRPHLGLARLFWFNPSFGLALTDRFFPAFGLARLIGFCQCSRLAPW